MLKISRKDVVDFKEDYESYLGELSKLGFIYYDKEDLVEMKRKADNSLMGLKSYTHLLMRECTGGDLVLADRASMIKYLTDHLNVPEHLLTKTSKDSYGDTKYTVSVDAKTMAKVQSKGYKSDLIDHYLEITSGKIKNGLIGTAIKSCIPSDKVSHDGAPLYKVFHNITPNETLRTYYSDFNHQQLGHNVTAMKSPSDYIMVKGDFAQSDLKIAYNMLLRDKSNIDLFYKTPDSYKAVAKEVEDDEFSEESFKENRPVYKVYTLAPLYGGVDSVDEESKFVIDGVVSWLETLPVYVEFRNRIQKRIDCNLPVNVKSYFGNVITRYPSTNKRGKSDNDVMNQCLNAPIQTGTSEIVTFCGNSIMKQFKELGVTSEDGGVYCYLNRHDELVFLLHKDHIDKSYVFQQNENILVDDWMPLRIEFEFTTSYTERNEEIDNLCKSYYKEPEVIDVQSLIEQGKSGNYYIPCEDTLELNIGVHRGEGSSIICMENEKSGRITYLEINTTDTSEILDAITSNVTSKSDDLFRNDVTAVHIRTSIIVTGYDVFTTMPIVFNPQIVEADFRRLTHMAREKYEEINK